MGVWSRRWTHGFMLLLFILSLLLPGTGRAHSSHPQVNDNDGDDDGFGRCEATVRNWAHSSSAADNKGINIKQDKQNLKDMLFFLHIPRTGGRTYFYCFLRKLYKGSQECPRSYDKLRFDPSKSSCRLMVTHDDYSLVTKLPKERTSVVTVLRNPIDRVFSAYEFSVEVAARFLVHPNLTSVTQMSVRLRPKSRGVSTLDIWPWKYLVPWMREDLFARRDARKFGGSKRIQDVNDPYNMENVVMPLHKYINDPLAHELIHNGATFQVAGLTNNSYIAEAHEVRHCVQKHPELGYIVLEIAKSRLNHMLFIGLTEDHKESAMMFANMVGAQVLSQSEAESSHVKQETFTKTEINHSSKLKFAGSNQIQHSTDVQGRFLSQGDTERKDGNMTVEKLMEDYEECVSSLRKGQTSRRTVSLKRISPANFTKKARRQVPEAVIQQILSLNSLDIELYKHAQNIFIEQQKHIMQHMQSKTVEQQNHLWTELEKTNIMCRNSYWCFLWKALFAALILIIIVLVLMVVTNRRTSKVKI